MFSVHGAADVQLSGLGELAEIELDDRLVGIGDVEFVLLELVLDELGVETAIGHRIDHRVGDVPDTAKAGCLERQIGRRDIDAHAADDDGHQFLVAQLQTKIINTFHQEPSTDPSPVP